MSHGPATPSPLIDAFLPAFDVAASYTTRVAAPVATTYVSIRRVDLGRSQVVRVLFAARGLAPFRARRRTSLTLDDLVPVGFVVLAERPGAELVLGIVGAFWRPRARPVRVDPDAFAAFDRPGYAKAVWNIEVADAGDGTSRLATTTRVRATDPRSRRRFLRYWRVVGPFSGLIRRELLRLARADAEGS